MRTLVRRLIGLAVFLGLWEAVGRLNIVDPYYLPPPSVVLVRFVELFGNPRFPGDVASTLLSWAIAIVLATIIAVPLGTVLGSFRPLRLISGPIIEFLRPLPTVALIPLVILVIGSGAQTKILLATFASTWPILFNTMYAFNEIDSQVIETARAFRTRRVRLFSTVIMPSIAPFVMTGVRLSASVALVVLVSTEFLTGGTVGIGQFVYVWGSNAGRMDMVLAGTICTGIFGYLVNVGLLAGQRRWLKWSPTGGAV